VVTERVEKDLKIKEHLDRFNAVSKATSDTIWDLDMKSGRLLWNHGIRGIFGYRELEQSYTWWHERVHPDDVTEVTKIIENCIVHKLSRWKSEYRFRCADDSYKDVLDRGFLLFDETTGKPVRMIGAMQDISERVAYTRSVEKHNERLKEIAWTQAHLVRGPLTRILGIIPLLTDSTTEKEAQSTLLSYLKSSATDLDQVIRTVIEKSDNALKQF
jgi:PAS domain S-box-containing protein